MRTTALMLLVSLSLIALAHTATATDDLPSPREIIEEAKEEIPDLGMECVGPWTMQIGPLKICDPFMGNPPW